MSSVPQPVADVGRELYRVRYAALGVLDEDDELTTFLTSGIDNAVREGIGEFPSGKGLREVMLKQTEPSHVSNKIPTGTGVDAAPVIVI